MSSPHITTAISRRVAGAMTGLFVALILAVPTVQALLEVTGGRTSPLRLLMSRRPTKQNIASFEQALEDASLLRAWVRPRAQEWLTDHGRAGNTKAVIGRDGWLFYAPGIASVTGPGILDPSAHEVRRRAALDAGEPAVHPDPRPAILELHRVLLARGIRLVLLPIPDKVSLEPHRLHAGGVRARAAVPVINVDEPRLWRELRRVGIEIFDPTLVQHDPFDSPRFLAQDTHWTPDWMRQVATALARALQTDLPRGRARAWRTVPATVRRVGDLVDMLGLPLAQVSFVPEAARILEVRDERGEPFRSQPDADVLLLGDSFTNIYSLPSMGWGASAGLGAQLAAALGRDVDVIAQNDAGAFATRQLLARELAAGRDRLAGKRVVIWQFAARELAVGDWRPVVWPPPSGSGRPVAGRAPGRFFVPPTSRTIEVTAEVLQASAVPRPAEVPYKDHIRALHLRVAPATAGGEPATGEALAYVYSMRDSKLVRGAQLQPGTTIRARLQPWAVVSPGLDGVNRSELDDVALLDAEPAWAEVE